MLALFLLQLISQALRSFFTITFLSLFFILSANTLCAQVTVTGTVFDSAKRNYVENVRVLSSSGAFVITDSMGNYKIPVSLKDSLSFIYNNKPTQKFAVQQIANLNQFDIMLHMPVKSGIKTLEEVVVFSKTHQQIAAENRDLYEGYFNFKKPTIKTSVGPGGAVGADLTEIINMFRFRRNKQLAAFRDRLEQQEEDGYVNYRFNKNFVGRITQLKGAELDSFMVRYIPSYEFASMADEVTFNKYILNSSYAFKIELLNSGKPLTAEEIKMKRDLWKKIN